MKNSSLAKTLVLFLAFVSVLIISSCSKKAPVNHVPNFPKPEATDYNALIGNDTEYNCVYQTSTLYYAFEVISTKENAEQDAKLAASILSEKFSDIKWFCHIIDENEVYLGKYSEDEYEPFVYERYYDTYTTPSFVIPFAYYFGKYLDGFRENVYYEYVDINDNGQGVTEYIFTIKEIDPRFIFASKERMQTITDLTSKTLGNNIVVRLKAFVGTADEIIVEACSQ